MAMFRRKRFILGIVIAIVIIFIGVIGVQAKFMAARETKSLLTTQAPKITLEIFSGKVFMTDPTTNQETEAINGQAVDVGSLIRADATGRAQVLYTTGTVTRIDHNSSMTITKADLDPQEITVNITVGRVWSRVKKLLGNESYQTQTGSVVAAVRGTSYGHGILADGRNKIQTTKHIVTVNCLNNTQSGDVINQTKLFLDCHEGSLSNIEPLDDTDTQDEWYKFNLEQDRLLDLRFGAGIYDDEGEVQGASASATPIMTAKPAMKLPTTAINPVKTTQPTARPNLQTPTPQPTIQPTLTPSPIPKQTPTESIPPSRFNPNLQLVNPQLFRSIVAPSAPPPQIN